MKPGRVIALYAGAILLLGCLLAPWVFLGLQQWGEPLARYPFRRVFNRVLLIVGLIGLWPMLRALGVRHWRDIGWSGGGHGGRQFLWGLLLGLASLSLAASLVFWLGGRQVRDVELAQLASRCAKFALSALAVGLVEETFFRGGIQNALARSLRWGPALVLTSAIYSVVHFLKPRHILILPADVTWWTGFDYLGQVLAYSVQAEGMGRGFVTLWLAGMVLGSAYCWSGRLYLPIGLHAGWVLMLKTFSWLTQPGQAVAGWWASVSLVDSVVVWPVMLLLWGGLWWQWRRAWS